MISCHFNYTLTSCSHYDQSFQNQPLLNCVFVKLSTSIIFIFFHSLSNMFISTQLLYVIKNNAISHYYKASPFKACIEAIISYLDIELLTHHNYIYFSSLKKEHLKLKTLGNFRIKIVIGLLTMSLAPLRCSKLTYT